MSWGEIMTLGMQVRPIADLPPGRRTCARSFSRCARSAPSTATGVAQRGEQYRGWRALPPGPLEAADRIRNRAEALEFFRVYGPTFEDAAKRLHPDIPGGDAELFRAAVKARDILAGVEL